MFALSRRQMAAAATSPQWMLFRMRCKRPLDALVGYPKSYLEGCSGHQAVVAIPADNINVAQVQGSNGRLQNAVVGWRKWTHVSSPDGILSQGSFQTEDGSIVEWEENTSHLDNPDFPSFEPENVALYVYYAQGHSLRGRLEWTISASDDKINGTIFE